MKAVETSLYSHYSYIVLNWIVVLLFCNDIAKNFFLFYRYFFLRTFLTTEVFLNDSGFLDHIHTDTR
jgi:hypothetical protein